MTPPLFDNETTVALLNSTLVEPVAMDGVLAGLLGWVPLLAVVGFLFLGNVGYGTLIWVVTAELLPPKVNVMKHVNSRRGITNLRLTISAVKIDTIFLKVLLWQITHSFRRKEKFFLMSYIDTTNPSHFPGAFRGQLFHNLVRVHDGVPGGQDLRGPRAVHRAGLHLLDVRRHLPARELSKKSGFISEPFRPPQSIKLLK